MTDTTAGPTQLNLRPSISVTRLNKTALWIAGGAGLLAAGAILYSFQSNPSSAAIQAKDAPIPTPVNEQPWYATASDALPTYVRPEPEPPAPVQSAVELPKDPPAPKISLPEPTEADRKEQQVYENALRASPMVPGFSQAAQQVSQDSRVAQSQYPAPDQPVYQEPDQNRQAEKQRWLEEAGQDKSDYLPSMVKTPISPYEVKAGSVIPAVMISGINSDLPGQLIAQVRESVYDSATGRHLLIPQGAKLVGLYDSGVSYGQQRLLIAWNRIIFPNGSSLNLQGQPGADIAGMSGFHDKVNNHYFRTFGSAILLSMISAGFQVSQPQDSDKHDSLSATEILAGALGQTLGQTSAEMLRKNMNIQPTLEIRPGYPFNIIVTQDLILSPYHEE
jgi:type IV secretory pathway VirB10-like protein